MDKRDPYAALRQIYTHAVEAVEICSGKSREDLDYDRRLNLALARLIEIIGEAAGRVSESFQDNHPDLPWMQKVAARNRLIHGHDSVIMMSFGIL